MNAIAEWFGDVVGRLLPTRADEKGERGLLPGPGLRRNRIPSFSARQERRVVAGDVVDERVWTIYTDNPHLAWEMMTMIAVNCRERD